MGLRLDLFLRMGDDMTDTNNGWPGEPGVPLNPGLPGAHWLKGYTKDAWMYDGDGGWWGPGYSHKLDAETVAARYSYLGPCLTPAEAVALQARVAELEAELRKLLALNDNHGFFGGEIYQDRVNRAWDAARAALEGKMSNDLVKRLRCPPFGTETSERNLMEEAAAEITRLRAALASARRDGMEEARAIFNDAIENTPLEGTLLMRQIAAAIRAAAGEVKKDE
jgi:hypothetical protein